MNALIVIGIISFIIYSVLVDGTFFKIYIPLVLLYWLVTHFMFNEPDHMWKRRRITISSWSTPDQPTSYLPVEYDVTNVVSYMDKYNQVNKDGHKLTMTYMMTKALAISFNENIENVGRIAFGKFRRMKQVDISILADVKGGKDLVPVNVTTPHLKSFHKIADEVYEKANRAKSGKDEVHKKNTQAFDILPSFITGPILGVITYITLSLGWSIPFAGIKGDMFPPIVLTNTGSLGITAGFAPMPPMSSMIVAWMGKVVEKPLAINGEVVIRKVMTIVYSFDHRIGDASIMIKTLRFMDKCIENPSFMDNLLFENGKLVKTEEDTKKNQ